jgi:hypothetical protein
MTSAERLRRPGPFAKSYLIRTLHTHFKLNKPMAYSVWRAPDAGPLLTVSWVVLKAYGLRMGLNHGGGITRPSRLHRATSTGLLSTCGCGMRGDSLLYLDKRPLSEAPMIPPPVHAIVIIKPRSGDAQVIADDVVGPSPMRLELDTEFHSKATIQIVRDGFQPCVVKVALERDSNTNLWYLVSGNIRQLVMPTSVPDQKQPTIMCDLKRVAHHKTK